MTDQLIGVDRAMTGLLIVLTHAITRCGHACHGVKVFYMTVIGIYLDEIWL